jgi:hypothetical protein
VYTGVFHNFYKIYLKLVADFGFTVKLRATYNADDSGFPFNNKPPKTVSGKGRSDVIELPNKNITVVASVLPVKFAIDSTVF